MGFAQRSGDSSETSPVVTGDRRRRDEKLMAILLDNVLLGMIGESLIKFNVLEQGFRWQIGDLRASAP